MAALGRTGVLLTAGGLISLLGLAGCGGSGPADLLSRVGVTITPTTAAVAAGDTQQFTASVTGTSNTGVTWSVNDIAGGNPTVGTISSTGLYSAPDTVPSPSTVTVAATSQANTSKSASASVTVTAKLSALSPIVVLQNSPAFALRVFGRGFTATSVVFFGGTPKPTTLVSSKELGADISAGDIAVAGLVQVIVRDGEAESSALEFSVVPPLERHDVPVTAGVETGGVDIPVASVPPPALSLVALGIGETAGSTGVSIPHGSGARLLLVGEGIAPGTYYLIDGGTGEFAVTQPVAADFAETTDGVPAVHLQVSVAPSAALGPRNILVLNASGEVAAFIGGVLVTE